MNARDWLEILDTKLAGPDLLAAASMMREFDALYPDMKERNQWLRWLERERAALTDAAAREFGRAGHLPLMDPLNAFLLRRRMLEARQAMQWWLTTPGADAAADAPLAAWVETWLVGWWQQAGQMRWAAILCGLAGRGVQLE